MPNIQIAVQITATASHAEVNGLIGIIASESIVSSEKRELFTTRLNEILNDSADEIGTKAIIASRALDSAE